MNQPAENNKLQQAAEIIRAGGLVAFPTETVYGLGADATNAKAIARIFEVKCRPRLDPLIVHIIDMEQASDYAEVNEQARRLAAAFWPGSLTLVLPRLDSIPDLVTAGLETVAVRAPDHPMAQELLRLAGCPVAAPSANLFGKLSPTTAGHVREQLGDTLDLILDGGPCRVGVESTVLSLVGEQPELLRPGGISVEQIEEIAGGLLLGPAVSARPDSPGQLKTHYEPRTRMVLLDPGALPEPSPDAGLLAFGKGQEGFGAVEVLSPSCSLVEAAANLFASLHRLDASGVSVIYAERVPEEGLGRAIMDRLRRGADHREA